MMTPDPTMPDLTPPRWWDAWWSKFQAEQWRNIRRTAIAVTVAAVLSLMVSCINWVQADLSRGVQAGNQEQLRKTQEQGDRIEAALDRILTAEASISEDAGLVADYIQALQERQGDTPPIDPSVTLEALRSIGRIQAYLESLRGAPLPEAPTVTPPLTPVSPNQ